MCKEMLIIKFVQLFETWNYNNNNNEKIERHFKSAESFRLHRFIFIFKYPEIISEQIKNYLLRFFGDCIVRNKFNIAEKSVNILHVFESWFYNNIPEI